MKKYLIFLTYIFIMFLKLFKKKKIKSYSHIDNKKDLEDEI